MGGYQSSVHLPAADNVLCVQLVSLVYADLSLVKELFIEFTKKWEVMSPAYLVQRWGVRPVTEHAAAVSTDIPKMLQHHIIRFFVIHFTTDQSRL